MEPSSRTASGRGGSSFTVFQVPAAATAVPDAARQQQQYQHPMVSFGEWGGGGASSSSSTSSLNASLASLDDALYTHSGRSQRGSISTSTRFPTVGNSSGTGSEVRGGISWMRSGRVIRVKDSGESFRFPLEDDHLPRVRPTPEQYAVLKKRAHALAEQSVNSSYLWMENPTLSPELKKQAWKVHVEKKNCVTYRQRGSDRKHALSRRAISLVDAVFSVRDVLMFEYTRTLTDARGQKVLVRVSQSVSAQDVNGTERNFGFLRGHATYVYLFRSMGPGSGAVDASLLATLQFAGNSTPAWLANKIVSGFGPAVLRLTTCADAKYVVKSRLLTSKTWVPNNERPACSVCFKSFNLLRSRHHCRICAEVMCSACTMELTLLTSRLPAALQPDTGANLITSTEKFCLKCINQHRQERCSALVSMRAAQSARSTAAASFDHLGSDVRDSDVALGAPRRSLSDAGSVGSINYYGWGSMAAPSQRDDDARYGASVGSSYSSDGARGRPNSYSSSYERRRQGSDASASSGYSDGSSSSESRWEKETGGGLVLLEEAVEDVVSVAPIPTTFVKMEESIAAQQVLLRNMMREGQKIMQHTQQQQQQRPYRPPPSAAIEGRPKLLALPPPSMTVD
ncbi:hypothetical protein PybrP1_006033 [[Pythium] brassicae (nom. inval.)]|nr:hypothetical protein PybrP1_006033 [[Pythium] brassicae (nom. inval.)]